MSLAGYHSKGKEREREWVLDVTLRVVRSLRALEQPSLEAIDAAVAFEFRIAPEIIRNHSLWCIDVAARQIAMTLAYLLTDIGTVQLGEHYGRVDHTTIIYAHRKYGQDVFGLCVTNGVKATVRIKGKRKPRLDHLIFMQRKIARTLEALLPWRDGPTLAEDIFPTMNGHERSALLRILRHRGYALSEGSGVKQAGKELLAWQVTDHGIQTYERLKHLLRSEPEKMKEAA